MPIPMGRSGNVDGEGRTANGGLRPTAVVGSGRNAHILRDYWLREWMVSAGVQPNGSLRRFGTALFVELAEQGTSVLAPPLAPIAEVAELPNDADSDGADGS